MRSSSSSSSSSVGYAEADRVGAGEVEQRVREVAGVDDEPAHGRVAERLALVLDRAKMEADQPAHGADLVVAEAPAREDVASDLGADLRVVVEGVPAVGRERVRCRLADVVQQRRGARDEVVAAPRRRAASVWS